MKNGKKLTVKEMFHLQSLGMKPQEWLISKKCTDRLLLVNRKTLKTCEVPGLQK